VPAGDAWLHEPKLDGYRLQVIKEGRQVAALQPPRQ
jgi:ATP-dependent DNA ligase